MHHNSSSFLQKLKLIIPSTSLPSYLFPSLYLSNCFASRLTKFGINYEYIWVAASVFMGKNCWYDPATFWQLLLSEFTCFYINQDDISQIFAICMIMWVMQHAYRITDLDLENLAKRNTLCYNGQIRVVSKIVTITEVIMEICKA